MKNSNFVLFKKLELVSLVYYGADQKYKGKTTHLVTNSFNYEFVARMNF